MNLLIREKKLSIALAFFRRKVRVSGLQAWPAWPAWNVRMSSEKLSDRMPKAK